MTYLPPIPDPEKILCVGLNYLSHIKEGGREPPEKPIIFTRYPNSQVGHGEKMERPNVSVTFDYEGELAVDHRPSLPACEEGRLGERRGRLCLL